ncbi:hypothetical protein T484DRAFT_1810950 [Baffinella frigidus]|nr:hypothetical protein T484DRAFT_1810950 [Cryptophyta sp. CCMP2293]
MPVPSAHSGLGLPQYAQVTSPIRRYSDLVLHRVLKDAVSGLPATYSAHHIRNMMPQISQRAASIQRLQMDPEGAAYSAHGIRNMVPQISQRAASMQRLQRSSERFWVLEHIRRQLAAPGARPEGVVLEATILRVNRVLSKASGTITFNVNILLNDLGHIDAVRGLTFNPGVGTRVKASVTSVNPHSGVLDLVILPR